MWGLKHLQCKVWALASKSVAVVVKLVLGSGLNLLKKVDDQSTSYTVGLLYRGNCKVNVVEELSYSTVLGAAIKCTQYSGITVDSCTHGKTVQITLNIFGVHAKTMYRCSDIKWIIQLGLKPNNLTNFSQQGVARPVKEWWWEEESQHQKTALTLMFGMNVPPE